MGLIVNALEGSKLTTKDRLAMIKIVKKKTA
jgi:hypothetical protein